MLLTTLFPSLTLIVNTHCHADHITSTGLMKKRLVGLKSAISKFSGASADIQLSEGDKISFGKHVREDLLLFSMHKIGLRICVYVIIYKFCKMYKVALLYFDLLLLYGHVYCLCNLYCHPNK